MIFLKDNYIILLIFLLGLGLRLYNLAAESIWFDEAFSATIIKQDALSLIKYVLNAPHETNPPLYYVILHFWHFLFGDSEFSLRLLSAVLGSVSIIVIYMLGKLLFNKRVGILAALILSVSVFHIQYAQEARGYMLTVLLSLLSFYALVKLTNRRSIGYSVLYIVTSVMMIYTHYYGIFVIVAQNVFCLTLFLIKRKAGEISIKSWITLQLVIVLSFIPGLLHILKMRSSMQKSFWIEEPTMQLLGQYSIYYSGSVYLLVVFVLFVVISLIGQRRLTRVPGLKSVFKSEQAQNKKPGISNGNRIYLLALWLVLPLLIPITYSIVSTPIFVSRYSISSTLAFYLLASYGISTLSSRWAITAIGLLILVLSFLNLPSYYSKPYKHQWREAVAEIERSARGDDVIIVYPAHEQMSLDYYKTRDDIRVLAAPEKFPSFRNLGNNSIWVIMHAHPQNRASIRQGLSGKYNFELTKGFVRLDLFRLKQK